MRSLVRWPAACLVVALAGCATASPGTATAAGPWQGQVVDAETGQPLEGVVVVAVWDKMSPGAMHPRREFHDVDEVVTDTDGRFVLPERRLLTPNPFVSIAGPELYIFKGGYGRWAFRGAKERSNLSLAERVERSRELWKGFADGRGGAFELPPLKSRQERLRFLPPRPTEAPYGRTPRFDEALDQERIDLGLSPLSRSPNR